MLFQLKAIIIVICMNVKNLRKFMRITCECIFSIHMLSKHACMDVPLYEWVVEWISARCMLVRLCVYPSISSQKPLHIASTIHVRKRT